jgi:hypothetical protein
MMADYKETEWRKIVAGAESNINGDCPLIEDEAIVWANARIAELEKLYAELYLHADALTFGTDWNKGAHALLHGHRKGLIYAVKALKEQVS